VYGVRDICEVVVIIVYGWIILDRFGSRIDDDGDVVVVDVGTKTAGTTYIFMMRCVVVVVID
jgi:hypothetical protein